MVGLEAVSRVNPRAVSYTHLMCHQIVADYLGGNQARAVENHLKYLKLMNHLFIEVNPIPVSYTHLTALLNHSKSEKSSWS